MVYTDEQFKQDLLKEQYKDNPYSVYTREELEKQWKGDEKMEDETKIGIGSEEMTALKPMPVVIQSIAIEVKGEKNSKIAVCLCKHPEKQEVIHISRVKYENKGNLEISGIWINKDSKGLIQKGSALATFLQFNNSNMLDQLIGKTIQTTIDDKGYLCFKSY